MHPYLPGGLRAYPAFLALAVLVAATSSIWLAQREGLALRRHLFLLGGFLLSALLGAKLYSIVERGGTFYSLLAEAFDAYRYPGAILGLLVALAVVARPSWTGASRCRLGDIIAPSICFGMAVVRVGCFLNGCCYGPVCNLPWALRFPAHSPVWNAQVLAGLISPGATPSLPVHPLQLYFALFAAALGVVLLWFLRRKAYDGQVLLLYLAVHDLGKFGLESLRFRREPHLQLMSLSVAALALAVLAAAKLAQGQQVARARHRTNSEATPVNT